ncbi:MAG: dephospho-CoA kinase [Bacteroidales bacterium]|jgi:dephospho-CoA kinase|nr:dephospho-CoA kinase [Bacteroidales bacterium]
MLKVAITGNIGSGKSTVAHFFENLDIPLFSADKAGHDVLQNPDVIVALQKVFGDAIFDETGSLSRKNIAHIVFANDQKLKQLNAVVHPEIKNMIVRWMERQNETTPYILVEAAVLFEAGFDDHFDKIIVASAPKELRIERVLKRDDITREEVLQRINAQISEQEKIERSDFVIINDGINPIIPQILNIHFTLHKA